MRSESRGFDLPLEESAHPDFAVLVGGARSGTTLLRLILDAHPKIGCPAEAGIPGLISHLGRVWWTIDSDVLDDRARDPLAKDEAGADLPGEAGTDGAARPQSSRLPRLPDVATAAIREAVLAPMRHYCQREGKRIYCDKSLDSVHHLEAVRQIFPATRYVLLVRHVMDTVASGIEASPWGFQAFGYLPFVQRSPDNFVAALVNYWTSHVHGALTWQQEHPELCHRVRYEDLVTDPVSVVGGIFSFLGVDHDPAVLERAFLRAPSAKGPGDYKVTFTSAVAPASIGRGKSVPVEMLPPPLLEAANDKLKALGYEPLGRAWNAEPSHTNGRERELNRSAARLGELLGKARLSAGAPRSLDSFALVAQDDERLRWVVDLAAGTIRQGDGEVEWVITGTTEDLGLLLSGEVNPGVLLRSGRIRHLTAEDDRDPTDAIEAARVVLHTLGDVRARPDSADALGP